MATSEGSRNIELRLRADPTTHDRSWRTAQRRVHDGSLARVRVGVLASADELAAANSRARELARIEAVVRTRRSRVVLSHEAAATVWGLPRLGPPPECVDLLDLRSSKPRSMNGVRWRRTPFDADEVVEHRGFLVTGLLQTVVDLACERSFVSAVLALDAAVGGRADAGAARVRAPLDAYLIAERLEASGRRRGCRAARRAIAFADGHAESPGESLSRVRMHELGYPAPELQVEFERAAGGVDRVDFDWPGYGVFGEFDGDLKYLDPRYRGGRSAEQVMLDEKKRDQRICTRHRRRSAHWDWATALRPRAFAAVLEDLGLPRAPTPAPPYPYPPAPAR